MTSAWGRYVPLAALLGLSFGGSVSLQAQAPHAAGGVKAAPAPGFVPSATDATARTGSIEGRVLDDHGNPIPGAMISALGAASAFATTDKSGWFRVRELPAGVYLVRAHLSGFATAGGQTVAVQPNSRAAALLSLRRVSVVQTASVPSSPEPVLAGFLAPAQTDADTPAADAPTGEPSTFADDDHSEATWRLRHLPRHVLKDAVLPVDLAPASDGDWDDDSFVDRALGSSARLASMLSDVPFSGEFNLLTTSMFDAPQELFKLDGLSRSLAYLSIGAPVGTRADWAFRGAVTEGPVEAWVVAGSYAVRESATHAYEVGMSYSTQRYDATNPVAMTALAAGSRSVGTVHGYDRWTLGPHVALDYGLEYERYDYLASNGLLSPRAGVTLSPNKRWHFHALASSRATAPGADEFLPPAGGGSSPPLQRTFSPLAPGSSFDVERTTHLEAGIDHNLADGSIVRVRAFRQEIGDQIVTLFGLEPGGRLAPELGHYFVANAGDARVRGVAVGLTHEIANRLRGSLQYTLSRAQWGQGQDAAIIGVWAPSSVRPPEERLHDLTTSVEAEIPQTSTRILVLYRLNSGFVRPDDDSDRAGIDARFDVQLTQALPFMNFSSAQWEMLVGVRNFFREQSPDGSYYDELLVVRPPKRIVGGLALRF